MHYYIDYYYWLLIGSMCLRSWRTQICCPKIRCFLGTGPVQTVVTLQVGYVRVGAVRVVVVGAARLGHRRHLMGMSDVGRREPVQVKTVHLLESYKNRLCQLLNFRPQLGLCAELSQCEKDWIREKM